MRGRRTSAAAAYGVALLSTACWSVPGLPEGSGEGLISVDMAAPADGNAVERPTWAEGDQFVYLYGGETQMRWRVTRADETGYDLTEDPSGQVTRLDADLGLVGRSAPDDPWQERARAPVDSSWAWPLWVGKRWSTRFVQKAPDSAVPVQADYVCDARETVTVPAGTFECLRVWRSARPAVEGRYLAAVSVAWFAPEVGYMVKRLEDGALLELQQVHRQTR